MDLSTSNDERIIPRSLLTDIFLEKTKRYRVRPNMCDTFNKKTRRLHYHESITVYKDTPEFFSHDK